MKSSIIVVITFLLYACNGGKDSYESKLNELFFNANTNANYNTLINYFRTIGFLKEVEYQGWTSYPPLSALAEADNETISTLFEFQHHPKISSQLKNGTLTIRKIGPNDSTLATLEISFGLISKAVAQNLYNTIIEEFEEYAKSEDETLSEDFRLKIFGKNGANPGLKVTLFHNEINSVYIVTLTVVGQEP